MFKVPNKEIILGIIKLSFYVVVVTATFDAEVRRFSPMSGANVRYGYINLEPTTNCILDVEACNETMKEKWTGCAIACIYEELCMSFNAILDTVTNMMRCSLLSTDKYRSSNTFRPETGSTHYEIFVS